MEAPIPLQPFPSPPVGPEPLPLRPSLLPPPGVPGSARPPNLGDHVGRTRGG